MVEVEFTKLSSKGQIVIPLGIRRDLGLVEGTPIAVIEQEDTVLLKKMEIPKAKTWTEATKPFREAAKKSRFKRSDLDKLIREVRKSK